MLRDRSCSMQDLAQTVYIMTWLRWICWQASLQAKSPGWLVAKLSWQWQINLFPIEEEPTKQHNNKNIIDFLHYFLSINYVSYLTERYQILNRGFISNENGHPNLSSIQKRKQFGQQLFPALHLSWGVRWDTLGSTSKIFLKNHHLVFRLVVEDVKFSVWIWGFFSKKIFSYP